jgi:hypothetical protein
MMFHPKLVVLAAIGIAHGSTFALAEVHSGVHPAEAVIVQVLNSFDNPEAALFSADGRFVFISNSAEIGSDRADGFGFAEGEGYISKLEVQPSGTLVMVEEKLVTGITGPLGMAALTKATGTFPAGTIFACSSSAPMRDSAGQVITDPARMRTKIVAFNVDGAVLGELDLGSGSLVEQINGSPIMLCNALGFDGDGNLFIVDSGIGGGQFDPPFVDKGGLWRIAHGALDAVAGGSQPAEIPSFLAIPGVPDGVEVSPKDGLVYVNTVGPAVGAPDPAGGGIYAINGNAMTLPAPIDRDMGALDGLDFTDGGVMLNTQIMGGIPARIYVNCPGKIGTTLEIQPAGSEADMNGPADIAIQKVSGGSYLVVVPELYATDPTPGDDEVKVLALPPDFEAACNR